MPTAGADKERFLYSCYIQVVPTAGAGKEPRREDKKDSDVEEDDDDDLEGSQDEGTEAGMWLFNIHGCGTFC